MSPEDVEGPPPDAADSAALNFMGRRGWELIQADNIVEYPPGRNAPSDSVQRRRYLFKRQLA